MSDRFCLFSPASCYPRPEARLIDARGEVIHTWSCAEDQPLAEEEPPSFLRGWNHVELDADGNLFAIVPLQALLKLDARSNLIWKCRVSAHHDIAIAPDGRVYVLCEEPALLEVRDRGYVILDHRIVVLDPDGRIEEGFSLYETLASDEEIADRIQEELLRRYHAQEGTEEALRAEARAIVKDAPEAGLFRDVPVARRDVLRSLRELPGSPCDVLHPNTLELVPRHPRGLWGTGHILLALRSLDLIVVANPRAGTVAWHWGRGEVDGPHQPSLLPDGNLLLFDNGVEAARSRLVEVDPVTRAIVWEYVAIPPDSFFSKVAGGCERLADGSVLVTDAQAARIFEVTRDKRIVWEHVVSNVPTVTNPHRTTLYRAAHVDGSIVAKLSRRGRVAARSQVARRSRVGMSRD